MNSQMMRNHLMNLWIWRDNARRYDKVHLHMRMKLSDKASKSNIYLSNADLKHFSWKKPSDDMPALHPLPPFSEATALQKVKAAEAKWNTRDPIAVSASYSEDTIWRNRDEFLIGRDAVQKFLARKWEKEINYKLKKHLWTYNDNRIAVRFEYEYSNDNKHYRAHGIELWEFDSKGYMRWRDMSANDIEIDELHKRLK